MLRERRVKDYFQQDGTVSKWWNPESSSMAHIYEREVDLLLEWLRGEDKKEVLDVSCGKGRILKRLFSPDSRLTGLDISLEMLASAQSLKLSHVDLLCGDAENLPLKSGLFDCAICLESLVHYPNPEKALRELSRVLKPEGILVTDVDNTYSLRRVAKNVTHWINRKLDKGFLPVGEDFFRTFKTGDYYRMLSSVGFEIEEIAYLGILAPIRIPISNSRIVLLSERASRGLQNLDKRIEGIPGLQQFATYIITKCRKRGESDASSALS